MNLSDGTHEVYVVASHSTLLTTANALLSLTCLDLLIEINCLSPVHFFVSTIHAICEGLLAISRRNAINADICTI